MSLWWRAYCAARHDPKLMLLPAEMFRAWFILICLAGERNGRIGPIADVAYALHVNESKAKATVAFLAGKRLLDPTDDGFFTPHNWNARQYKSDVSTDRVKRFRNRQNSYDETFQKRPQIQNTDTDSREEKKETRASALAPGWPVDFREQFWSAYPHKVGKADALRKLEAVAKSGKVSFDAMMEALFRYANKTDDRPFCNPATWIHQERWTDQPAPNNGAKNGQLSINRDLLQAGRELAARADQHYAEVCAEAEIFDRPGGFIGRSIPEG